MSVYFVPTYVCICMHVAYIRNYYCVRRHGYSEGFVACLGTREVEIFYFKWKPTCIVACMYLCRHVCTYVHTMYLCIYMHPIRNLYRVPELAWLLWRLCCMFRNRRGRKFLLWRWCLWNISIWSRFSFLWETGLPDGNFQTKNLYLGKFWGVLQWKMLVYFMEIQSILREF
jgi:hypothetical protein